MARIVIVDTVKKALSSEGAFRWILAGFFVQALFSVFFISGSTPMDGVGGRYVERNENGVVPDGHRHIGAIYYYAERPLLAGPTITDMPEEDLWMGDLERFPSYLYYYVLSFPVKVAMALNFPDTQTVWLIRLIGVGLGMAALIVFRRIVSMITPSIVVQNLSVLAVGLTGSFVWLSAAENYDVPALLLWFAFMYAALSLFTKNHAKYLYWMVLWFFLLSITKYTYIPFAGLAGLVSIVLYIRNIASGNLRKATISGLNDIRSWVLSSSRWLVGLGVISLVIAGGLFGERIVGNLVTFQSFNPSCTRLHSLEGCMEFGVFARNYRQLQAIESGTATSIEYSPTEYIGLWMKRYYDSMYVYMGHIYIFRYSVLLELSALAAITLGIYAFIVAKRKKVQLLQTQQEWFLLGVVVVLVLSQFLFNVNTMLKFDGQLYAHQGRYLLSAVGFAYILYFILIQRSTAAMSSRQAKAFIAAGIVVAIYAIATTSAVPSYFIHAVHNEWYSPLAQQILPAWLLNHSVVW